MAQGKFFRWVWYAVLWLCYGYMRKVICAAFPLNACNVTRVAYNLHLGHSSHWEKQFPPISALVFYNLVLLSARQ